jgi:hypothetical protein
VLGRLERSEDALAAFGDAVRLYDQKGNLVAAGRVRSDLVMPARL